MHPSIEKPRDFYANDQVWGAVYAKTYHKLRDAMDLALLTGQRPADVLAMRYTDINDGFLLVTQEKTSRKLRIQVESNGILNSLGLLIERIKAGNAELTSPFMIVNRSGKKVSWAMLRNY